MPPKKGDKGKGAASKKKKVDIEATQAAAAAFTKPPPPIYKYCGVTLPEAQISCTPPVCHKGFRAQYKPTVDPYPGNVEFPVYTADNALYLMSMHDDGGLATEGAIPHPSLTGWTAAAKAMGDCLLIENPQLPGAGPFLVDLPPFQPPVRLTAATAEMPKSSSDKMSVNKTPKASADKMSDKPLTPQATPCRRAATPEVCCRGPHLPDKDCNDCTPSPDLLFNMFSFTREELHELWEAFLYFATDLCLKIPTPPPVEDPASKKGGRKKKGAAKGTPKEAKPPKEKEDKKGGKKGGKKKKGADVVVETPAVEVKEEEDKNRGRFGLTRCAFAQCLRSVGQNPSELDLGILLRMAGKEPIDLQSFLYAVDCWTLRPKCQLDDDLWHAFKVFDYDDTGYIQICQLRAALEQHGEPLDADDLDELLCLSDPPDLEGWIEINQLVYKLVSNQRNCRCVFTPAVREGDADPAGEHGGGGQPAGPGGAGPGGAGPGVGTAAQGKKK